QCCSNVAADALAVGDDFESWTGVGSLHLQGDPPGRWCDRQAAASSLVGGVPCYLTPACSAPTRNSWASSRSGRRLAVMPPDAGDANLSLPPDQARPPAAAPPDPEGGTLKATQSPHERGHSLWLDNITRGLLDSGQIQHYIDNYAVTGLTSNPSIFDKAIETGD